MRTLLIAALSLASLGLMAAGKPSSPSQGSCHPGVYRLADGDILDIASTDDDRLRWRRLDGVFGRLKPTPDGGWSNTVGLTGRADPTAISFRDCNSVQVDGVAGARVPLTVTDTAFRSGKETLRGRLVLPMGTAAVPVVVQVHGSEKSSAVDFNYRQRQYPATGVGVFVYDKRGTGGSTGAYSQDFHLLSDDAAAALAEARRLAGKRASRIGFEGGSQGGWVAPLAATKVKADFVIVGFGLAEGTLAEDREEVMLDLREKGWGPDVMAKAREITDATAVVMASDFKDGFEELEAVKARYGAEPWIKDIQGEFTGMLLSYPSEVLKVEGPKYDVGTSWEYDPMPTLRTLDTPLLWVLASEDREAVPTETRKRLLGLIAEGRPITLLEFPRTDHGMYEFETGADGKRTMVRVTDGFTRAVLDFAKAGRLEASGYGAGFRPSP
jgi:pimeloyl-ACP methyl ester carboxylesterase